MVMFRDDGFTQKSTSSDLEASCPNPARQQGNGSHANVLSTQLHLEPAPEGLGPSKCQDQAWGPK